MVRNGTKRTIKFHKYYRQWIETYKKNSVVPVTFVKYRSVNKWIERLAPDLRLSDITRTDIQKLVNDYGRSHERATTYDFFHLLEAPLRDAVYEGWLDKDPCYKIKITVPKKLAKHKKWLELEDVHKLEQQFKIDDSGYGDWFDILLRTGLRFAELLGLTPDDVNQENMTISINKTMNYKISGEDQYKYGEWIPTKNPSSMRDVAVDYHTLQLLQKHMVDCPSDQSIVQRWSDNQPYQRPSEVRAEGNGHHVIFNSTFNSHLVQMCEKAGINRVTVHGLRHTHASLLIANQVSIQSVAKRLGHANTETTQRVYIHLLDDLKRQDKAKIMNIMSVI